MILSTDKLTKSGEVLKNKRQHKGWSADFVAEKLKIRKSLVLAVEQNNFSILPARVYLRGLIKSYCDVLGVPAKKILRQFDREYALFYQGSIDKKIGKRAGRGYFCLANYWRWVWLLLFLLILIFVLVRAEDIFGRPQIQISSPVNELTTTMDTILVQGKIKGAFRHFAINGQPTGVSEDGIFSEEIFLKNGINEIIFTATNLFGKKTENEVKIIKQ
ncbi:MAG: hypothetical protein COU85_02345 [Candidatus Portnoybacteria bacterium CG10_big_fil_rev_8_21_14_0_10_44_7]|uniref:HTH cro/C1-type domain-containing protein n=1 Tax=Candidatus Portnoybacteria bacterium CG10_big_fil_rev_8_21_14_0_10_44_7 TaxID=1974816 RepID=A0A2M8KIE4_9BACT|nr:MAG: hypothetical protein COU85_02345 [Candidatus Portnoybacteria bacterium CG10_big_fil_rev_8_21_14_0_10_44_7]